MLWFFYSHDLQVGVKEVSRNSNLLGALVRHVQPKNYSAGLKSGGSQGHNISLLYPSLKAGAIVNAENNSLKNIIYSTLIIYFLNINLTPMRTFGTEGFPCFQGLYCQEFTSQGLIDYCFSVRFRVFREKAGQVVPVKMQFHSVY